MANEELRGLKVAILITDGFEQVEMTEPRKALDEAGDIVSPHGGKVKGWKFTEWGDEFPVDLTLDSVTPDDFDALLLPGGVINPDKLRTVPEAVSFTRTFFKDEKPVAAICHSPWTIIETGAAQGRRMTSWPSLQTDLQNAGAAWIDQAAVRDGNLVTSRKPDDIPTFNRAMTALFKLEVPAEELPGIERGETFAPSLRSIGTRHKLAAQLKQFISIRWRTIFVFVCLGIGWRPIIQCDRQGKPRHHPCIFISI